MATTREIEALRSSIEKDQQELARMEGSIEQMRRDGIGKDSLKSLKKKLLQMKEEEKELQQDYDHHLKVFEEENAKRLG